MIPLLISAIVVFCAGFHIGGEERYRYPINGFNGYPYIADHMDQIKMEPEMMESGYPPGQTPSPMSGYPSPGSATDQYDQYGK